MTARPLLLLLFMLLALGCAGAASGKGAPKPLTAREARNAAYLLESAIAQERAALALVGTDGNAASFDIVRSTLALIDTVYDLKGTTVKNQNPLADVERARQLDIDAAQDANDPAKAGATLDALRQALAAKKHALAAIRPIYALDHSDPWCSGFVGKGSQSGILTGVSFTCHLGHDPATGRQVGDGWPMRVVFSTPAAFPGAGGSYRSDVSGKRSGICHPEGTPLPGTNASHTDTCMVDALHAGGWTLDWPNTDGKNTISSCGEAASATVYVETPGESRLLAIGWALNLTLSC